MARRNSRKFTPVTVRPSQGGALVASASADLAGLANYTRKVNFRRELDGEERREGWIPFQPGYAPQPLEASAPVRMLRTFRTPQAGTITFAAAGDKLYRYDNGWEVIAYGLWHQDGEGFRVADRWQCLHAYGYYIFNNGHDLPYYYKDGWESAHPMHSLREMGIASVGCMAWYGERLHFGNINAIEGDLSRLLRDSNPYGNIWDHNQGPIGTEVFTVSKAPHSRIWSSAGSPTLFSQYINGSMAVGSKEFRCAHKVSAGTEGATFQLGDEVIVSGAGVDGADLGTDPQGNRVKITGIQHEATHTVFTLSAEGITSAQWATFPLSFPLPNTGAAFSRHTLRLWKEEGAGAGYDDSMFNSGSGILAMEQLVDDLVVYREDGYYYLTRTNNALAPFIAEDQRYTGDRTADFRHTIIQWGDSSHLFAGENGVYALDRASIEPKELEAFRVGPQWWEQVPVHKWEHVHADKNHLTKEIFIAYPGNTLAFDYLQSTLSEIDEEFTAMAVHPLAGSKEKWFLMAVWKESGQVVRYGKGPEEWQVYHRCGLPYNSILQGGRIDFGEGLSNKILRGYELEVSDKSAAAVVEVTLSTAYTAAGPLYPWGEDEDDGPTILSDILNENLVLVNLEAPFIMDTLVIRGMDNPCRITSRTFDVAKTRTNGIQNYAGQ